MKRLKVYTDGGCSMKNKVAGWSFIILDPDTKQPTVQKSGTFESVTNNQMELWAVLEALHYVITHEDIASIRVEIVSDSEYVVKGATEWLPQWKGRGWKSTSGPVKNKILWETLDNFIQGMHVSFSWVRGHSADTINDKVDKLAVSAYQKLIDKREESQQNES